MVRLFGTFCCDQRFAQVWVLGSLNSSNHSQACAVNVNVHKLHIERLHRSAHSGWFLFAIVTTATAFHWKAVICHGDGQTGLSGLTACDWWHDPVQSMVVKGHMRLITQRNHSLQMCVFDFVLFCLYTWPWPSTDEGGADWLHLRSCDVSFFSVAVVHSYQKEDCPLHQLWPEEEVQRCCVNWRLRRKSSTHLVSSLKQNVEHIHPHL